MKKIFGVLILAAFLSCGGGKNAENAPTDLDNTKNNDTSPVITDSLQTMPKDSTDTTRLKP